MAPFRSSPQTNHRRLFGAVICVALGTLMQALCLQSVLQAESTATMLMSKGLWQRIVVVLATPSLGATQPFRMASNGQLTAEIDFGFLLAVLAGAAAAAWLLAAFWISKRASCRWSVALSDWGIRGWLWWLIPGAWEFLRIGATLIGFDALQGLLLATPQMWLALSVAGWLATLFVLENRVDTGAAGLVGRALLPVPDDATGKSARPTTADSFRVPAAVWFAVAVYVVVLTAMNWQLYRGLLIPHGDSAMYEEHLWNVTHGKGFRSYLDRGIFLGEHIQVVHLLLIPLHWLWPSHLLLELCESLALAVGAIPVFWMARRHSGSQRAATLLAVAYLLYFPLHFLDIAIDLKTFRPMCFGVPLLLFAIDLIERSNFRGAVILLLLTLSAKEDFAIIVATLGVWIALFQNKSFQKRSFQQTSLPLTPTGTESSSNSVSSNSVTTKLGWAMAVFATVYLVLVLTVLIPWFREGSEPHYSAYFGELGKSPREILANSFARPGLVFGQLLSVRSTFYGLALLLPLGLLPLLSISRLAVGLPLFSMLCLLQLSNDPSDQANAFLIPFHHFHAPLVPIVFWAAAAGLGNVKPAWRWLITKTARGERSEQSMDESAETAFRFMGHFAWTSAVAMGFFLSLTPTGLAFWDPDAAWYWKKRYVVGKRAEMFAKVFRTIPRNANVASTDFIHPRFTHHARSYDYSHYQRRVSGDGTVPADTDYIVIDTQHHYSDIKRPDQIREYRDHPEQWQLLPDTTDGYFIVLKRKGHR